MATYNYLFRKACQKGKSVTLAKSVLEAVKATRHNK